MLSYLRLTVPLLFVAAPAFAQQYPNIAPTDPLTPAEELATFKVPAGFEVQLVASEPDIRKPIQIAFDAKGRLWASTSEEYPFPAVGRPGKDRLYVMEDFGPDGKAKKVSVFADDLNIPIGVLPLPDCKSVIVSSIDPGDKPDSKLTCWIWKLTDTDGDGKADKKEKLYGPFGCEDTHGMNNSYTLMPDGWVYACHGFKNDSRPKGKDGHEIHMNSGNTFRFRPDGSRIEIWTRGQVNPFGIAIDPYFNLYTADCHSKPITQLIRGATYQSFAKPHDGLGFAPHVTTHGHESTALCGLVYYAADHFPKEYLDHMFLGNVTSNCINYDKIEFKGSTPVATDKGKFLASSDLWFRPTDIKLGPDGALYFADFYNKIIGHYEVDLKHPGRDKLRGRVWRIVWRGEDGKGQVPIIARDWTTTDGARLISDTANPNIAVRLFALQQLAQRKIDYAQNWKLLDAETMRLMDENPLYEAMMFWALLSSDSGQLLQHEIIMSKLAPTESGLREAHVLRVASAIPHDEKIEAIVERRIRNSPSSKVLRTYVESSLSRPDPKRVQILVGLLAQTDPADDHLRMAIKVAIRESLSSVNDWDHVSSSGNWSSADIKTLSGIATAVPRPAAAAFLLNHLKDLSTDAGRLPINVEHATRYAADPKAVLKFIQSHKPDDAKTTIVMLNAYQQGLQKRGVSAKYAEVVALAEKVCSEALATTDAETLQAAVELAGSLKLASAFDAIAKVTQIKGRFERARLAGLTAMAAIDENKSVPVLVQQMNDAAEAAIVREKAAQVLAGLNRDDANAEMVKAFQTAPARLQTAMAVALAGTPKGAEVLLSAIETGKASARLLQDRNVQQRLNDRKLPKAAERIAALTKNLPTLDEKINRLIAGRRDLFAQSKGNAVLGKEVFAKNCAACHQIGNEGNKIGPQLDGIGGRGLDRLLEDVLDPNRNVDAAFRTTVVTTADGKNISGLALREEGEILVMADDKGKEVRIPKGDIESRRQSPLSPMPANVAEIIPEKEFLDLLAYLLTQKAKDK